MRLAVSQLAWPPELEPAAADLLVELGVEGVEVAPTKIRPRPLEITQAEASSYRRGWERRGLAIVAMQSLLFERPDLCLFQDAGREGQTEEYLRGMLRLAGWLGARAVVLGSPRNRTLGSLPRSTAWCRAVVLFGRLAEIARQHQTVLCLEPNPVEYGCDFITRASEGLELVRAVGDPGFALHLDAGGMTLSQDPVEAVFRQAGGWWRHFHVSEPFLGPVGPGRTDHRRFAAALRDCGYDQWISIEMKPVPGDALAALGDAVTYTQRTYQPGQAPTAAPPGPLPRPFEALHP